MAPGAAQGPAISPTAAASARVPDAGGEARAAAPGPAGTPAPGLHHATARRQRGRDATRAHIPRLAHAPTTRGCTGARSAPDRGNQAEGGLAHDRPRLITASGCRRGAPGPRARGAEAREMKGGAPRRGGGGPPTAQLPARWGLGPASTPGGPATRLVDDSGSRHAGARPPNSGFEAAAASGTPARRDPSTRPGGAPRSGRHPRQRLGPCRRCASTERAARSRHPCHHRGPATSGSAYPRATAPPPPAPPPAGLGGAGAGAGRAAGTGP